MAGPRPEAPDYCEELNTPITLPSHRHRAAVASRAVETRDQLAPSLGDEAWVLAERDRKFRLLIDHYGIDGADPDLWPKLAMALADKHVRGFQVRQRPGRRRGSVKVTARLEADIDALVSQGLNVRSAAEKVRKRYADAARHRGEGYRHDATTLEKLYHQRRAQKAKAGRVAQDEHKATSRLRRDAEEMIQGVAPDEAMRLFRIFQAWLQHFEHHKAEPAEAARMRLIVEAVHDHLDVPLDEPERVVNLILSGALTVRRE